MSNPAAANQSQALAEQRGRLLERIAQQRAELQVQWLPVQRAASKADRAVATVRDAQRYVQAHRSTFTLLISVTCAALFLVKPGRSFRLLKRGFLLWRGWRALQAMQNVVPGSRWGAVFDLIRRQFFPAAYK